MNESSSPPAPASPLRRKLLWLALAALGALLGWRIVALNLADHLAARGDTLSAERALALVPGHALASEVLAREKLDSDPQAAIALLEESLRHNPTRGMSYALLGAARDKVGDTERAGKAIEMAVAMAPAQVNVHLIAAAHYLGQNDVAGVLRHWSAALSRQGSLAQQLYPDLLRLLENPATWPAFRTLLEQPVNWWGNFAAHAANRSEKLTQVITLYDLSVASPENVLKGRALGAVLSRLQRDNLWLDARLAWLDSLPPEQLARLPEVFNGGFEAPISDIGFDWIRQHAGHVQVDVAPTAGAGGDRALYVLFRGPRVRFAHLYQFLALQPGRYVLQGRARADDLKTARGLVWTVACVGGPRETVQGVSEPVVGRTPWRHFEVAFSVPPSGCPAQRLRLQLDGKVALDFDASGQAWFDDIQVLPEGAEE